MDERISQLERTVSALHAEVKDLKESLVSSFRKIESNFELLQNQVSSLNTGLRVLNISVESLKGSTHEGFEDVGGKIETLTVEISKIGEVTKYDEYFKNLQAIKRLN